MNILVNCNLYIVYPGESCSPVASYSCVETDSMTGEKTCEKAAARLQCHMTQWAFIFLEGVGGLGEFALQIHVERTELTVTLHLNGK